jgi:hypothetical protein
MDLISSGLVCLACRHLSLLDMFLGFTTMIIRMGHPLRDVLHASTEPPPDWYTCFFMVVVRPALRMNIGADFSWRLNIR